jgi:transposase-like protein
MSILMNKEKMPALANELVKDIKTPDDLTQLSAMLIKMTVEAALNAEMSFHLG